MVRWTSGDLDFQVEGTFLCYFISAPNCAFVDIIQPTHPGDFLAMDFRTTRITWRTAITGARSAASSWALTLVLGGMPAGNLALTPV